MNIIVYSNPNCVQCEQTKKYLTNHNVTFEAKMIQDSPEVLDLIREKNYSSAPVVVAGDDSWSGFRPERLAHVVRVIEAENAK
jgi:glutaredoxin-like protein NrdH